MQDVEITMLEVGYEFGNDRILLWLPWVAKHVISKDSPLSNWLSPSGFMADADACIAVVVRPAFFLCLKGEASSRKQRATMTQHCRGFLITEKGSAKTGRSFQSPGSCSFLERTMKLPGSCICMRMDLLSSYHLDCSGWRNGAGRAPTLL